MSTTLNNDTPEEIDKVVITVIGGDRTGIVAGVSQVLAECEVNIEDMSSTILHYKNRNLFSMILLGDMSNATVPLKALKERLRKKGEELGVHIFTLHEEVFNFMNRVQEVKREMPLLLSPSEILDTVRMFWLENLNIRATTLAMNIQKYASDDAAHTISHMETNMPPFIKKFIDKISEIDHRKAPQK